MTILKSIFAIIGLFYVIYFFIGLIIDIKTFDQTKGGYQTPFENWSGKPVDWDSMDKNNTGLVKRGYVLDVYINGTTGMISFGIGNKKIDWQTPSARALKVHKPREALARRGFNPQF